MLFTFFFNLIFPWATMDEMSHESNRTIRIRIIWTWIWRNLLEIQYSQTICLYGNLESNKLKLRQFQNRRESDLWFREMINCSALWDALRAMCGGVGLGNHTWRPCLNWFNWMLPGGFVSSKLWDIGRDTGSDKSLLPAQMGTCATWVE